MPRRRAARCEEDAESREAREGCGRRAFVKAVEVTHEERARLPGLVHAIHRNLTDAEQQGLDFDINGAAYAMVRAAQHARRTHRREAALARWQ